MTIATIGVRHWARTLWRRTLDVAGIEVASRWPGRLQSSLPLIASGPNWQSALDMTFAGEAAADDETTARRHVPHHTAMAEAARPPRATPHDAPRARTDPHGATAGRVPPRERARRRREAGVPIVPGRVVDALTVAPVLRAYQTTPHVTTTRGVRSVALDLPAATHGRPVAMPVPVSQDRAEWPRLLARRAADRLAALPATTGMPAVDRTHLTSRWTGALVRTLDAAVQGARADAVVLIAAAGRPEGRHRDAARSGIADTGTDARSAGASGTAADVAGDTAGAASGRRRPDPQETSRRSRAGSPEPGSSSEHAATLRGAAPDVEPLHPLGLPSPWSAPAPDAAISVVPGPAGSASRVAPPTGLPSFPPLMPAAVMQPPAFGISGAALRQATRGEDPDVDDDDASTLADRIRGILRDEARRHGITLQ